MSWRVDTLSQGRLLRPRLRAVPWGKWLAVTMGPQGRGKHLSCPPRARCPALRPASQADAVGRHRMEKSGVSWKPGRPARALITGR